MSDPNAFTGAALDRAGERRRDPAWVAAQRAHPRARAVLAGSGGVAVTDEHRLAMVPLADLGAPATADARPPAPAGAGGTRPPAGAGPPDPPADPAAAGAETGAGAPDPPADPAAAGPEAGAGAPEPLLLGLDAAGPVFAADADGRPGLLGLREAAAVLPTPDGGLAAYAAALLGWHRRHRFCANCGAPTEIREAGHVRSCPACGAEHHPRTDPVVIMIVTREDALLLGRQARWPPGRYSALAGFVEPGESLEEAVAREVREESGVIVGPPRYVSSQPWPFPSSLMLGFTAPWAAGEPAVGDAELEDVRWFARAELERAVAGDDGPLKLPPRLAIARRLIEGWLVAR